DKDWAVDGSSGGTGHSKIISPLGIGKTNTPGPGIEGQQQAVAEKLTRIATAEPRVESGFLDDAEHVVVAFGTPAKFVRYAVRRLRDKGVRVGYVRPITLWPFPAEAVAAAAAGERDLCPGCGEPVAIRILLETIAELDVSQSTIGVVGIGCYTAFARTLDVDMVQALHGRAPSVATGVKRMQPDKAVFTLQGDG